MQEKNKPMKARLTIEPVCSGARFTFNLYIYEFVNAPRPRCAVSSVRSHDPTAMKKNLHNDPGSLHASTARHEVWLRDPQHQDMC